MILSTITASADSAARRYQEIVTTWQSILARAMTSSRFGYFDQLAAVSDECFAVSNTYFNAETDEITQTIMGIATEAHLRVIDELQSIDADSLSAQALAHLGESQTYLHNEVSAQVYRDVSNARQQLQRAVLEVYSAVRTRGISERRAQIEYQMTHSGAVNFEFVDRAGRRSLSNKFVRSLWRQTLLSVYNEVLLMTLAEHGIQRAAVIRVENGIPHPIEIISLTGEGDLRSYSEVRDEYFHPNSVCYLDLESAHV